MYSHQRTAQDKYLLLLSDGVTDVMTDDQIALFVWRAAQKKTMARSKHVAEPSEHEMPNGITPEEQARSARRRRAVELDGMALQLCLNARALESTDDLSAIVVDLSPVEEMAV